MTEKLKVGVVGAGGIFQWAHSEPLKNHPEIEIVAICDIIKEKAMAAAEQHGIPLACSDYRELIANEEIEEWKKVVQPVTDGWVADANAKGADGTRVNE